MPANAVSEWSRIVFHGDLPIQPRVQALAESGGQLEYAIVGNQNH
jgi:hypothetical protein